MPKVYHFNDETKPADAVYIGRAMPRQGIAASAWQNEYKISDVLHWRYVENKEQARTIALECFECEAREHLTYEDPHWLAPLIGHDLVCWCAPKGKPLTADDPLVCHGQVLLRLIAEREK